MLQKLVYAKVIILLAIWWAWTVLVDFFVIPTVFRTIDVFFMAGNLGIVVFSKLNNLEVIVSTALVAILTFQTRKNRKAFLLLSGSLVLWIIAMLYFTYLTPKITELTTLWKQADLVGSLGISHYPDIQQAHQFYHRLYVGIDTFKLLLLTVMLSYGVIKQEKWS